MAAGIKIDLPKVRNMGIIAHIDAGKTTTTEHILYYAGAIHRLGGVDEGNTTTDWMELEQQKGITIQSACVPLQWMDCRINLIDTPGHVDFTAEVERSLRVLDGCVVVFDAQKGVEAQTETVWRQADKYQVPRMVFINKMDIVGADFANALEEVTNRLQGRPVPVNIPVGSGSIKDSDNPFRGVIDLITMEYCTFESNNPQREDGKLVKRQPIPAEYQEAAQKARERLIDVLTEADDEDLITSAYLDGQPVAAEHIHKLLRKRTIAKDIQPAFCGSGREHIGVQLLMDGICRYLPCPLDRPAVEGTNPKTGKTEKRKPDLKEPFTALVFKIQADDHGELHYLRIYSGQMKPNSRALNAGKNVKEFLTKLFYIHADPTRGREPAEMATAGDIVAVTGPKEAITGDTLTDPQHPLLLETIRFAETVVSQSIEPESSADRAKLEQMLTILAREDPTFRWKVDPETGQTIMSGMGVLHLEVKTHRLREDFRLKVRVFPPRVSYRETLKKPKRLWGEFIRQTGTAPLFAKAEFSFEHKKGKEPITFINKVSSEKLSPLFLQAITQGVMGALQSGEVGFPVTDVEVTLLDVVVHPTDSNDVAFQGAAADAVNEALKENTVLLEPVMRLEVTVPDTYLGPVTADLMARRAEITETHFRGNLRVVEASVPLVKMFDYADAVRSLTQGRASYSMEPSHYAPAPEETRRKLLGLDME
jgi:elongation factor G